MTTHRYLVYNLCIESDVRLQIPAEQPSPDRPVDLYFTRRFAQSADRFPEQACVYAAATVNRFGESSLQLYRDGPREVIRFPRAADFALLPGRPGTPARPGTIVCTLRGPRFECMVGIWLLGYVLTYYLERCGAAAMHAAAVEIDGRAVLFLGDGGAGKSTLVAGMLLAGLPLLADDISVLECRDHGVVCRSGYPQVKLSPEQAQTFLGSAEGLKRVHPSFAKLGVPAAKLGSFASGCFPVERIYVPERSPTGGEDLLGDSLAQAEGLMMLLRHSFLAELLAAVKLDAVRLQLLARVARTVPMKPLRYENGYQHLQSVCKAVVADCALTFAR